jgi:ribonuclease HI
MAVQFHRERRREKIEEIFLWIKAIRKDSTSYWSFIAIDSKRESTSIFGSSDVENINRLQLIPVLEFLEMINDSKKRNINLYTDSKYLLNLLNEWIDKWAKTDFKSPDGKDRPNADLLRRIESLRQHKRFIVRNLFSRDEIMEQAEKLCCNELSLS